VHPDRRLSDRRGPDHYVIHTVGPVWHGGDQGEPEKLAACYRNALQLAAENGARTIAFPGISTGVYGYPVEDATRLAMTTVRDCLAELPGIEEVRFVTFGERATEVAERTLDELESS
jgi:O-acetyl-ADP-ribose deacetylase